MTELRLHEEVLPPAQRAVWARLNVLLRHWVLYGGTAIALRLGHRTSVDFDFFTSRSFRPQDILRQVPWLSGAERLQSERDTLTVVVNEPQPVQLSFFGGLTLGRVGEPDRAASNGVPIASLLDLAATKAAVVQERAESKDYLDLHALMAAGISLEQALAGAAALYGGGFNPAITIKALMYFEDGDLPRLPEAVKDDLTQCAATVKNIPTLPRLSDSIGKE